MENLENTEVIYTYKYSGITHTFDCIVTGYEFDIGISIQEKDNPDHYVLCMNGPSSPIWARYKQYHIDNNLEYSEEAQLEEYNKQFEYVTTQIKSGTVLPFLTAGMIGLLYNEIDSYIYPQSL